MPAKGTGAATAVHTKNDTITATAENFIMNGMGMCGWQWIDRSEKRAKGGCDRKSERKTSTTCRQLYIYIQRTYQRDQAQNCNEVAPISPTAILATSHLAFTPTLAQLQRAGNDMYNAAAGMHRLAATHG